MFKGFKAIRGQWLLLSCFICVFLLANHCPATDNSECSDCHEETINEGTNNYLEVLGNSIHGDLECVDCHQDISELPHNDELQPVNCGECHEDAVEIYKFHGRKQIEQDIDTPDCGACHGKHNILLSSNKNSAVSPLNLPNTCGRCHEDVDLTTKHKILYGKAVEVYKSSVHGMASLGGRYSAATCNDCHSSGNTAHRILGPDNPESSINHFNIPKTCGKCHRGIEQDYWEGIHGQLATRGDTGSPVCTDCHGEHGIITPKDPRSRVSPARVAEATCTPCHESARLNEKYGIPSGTEQTWVDSYHGLKSKAGDVTVANCASCHGAHRILPHTDSTSSIYVGNLQATCGDCHPGISIEMASTSIHGEPGTSRTPIANVISKIYIVAIIIIIGMMVIHWLLDYRKQIKEITRPPQIRRMTTNELWQHWLLMITFITLVMTGFALRFSDVWLAKSVFGHEGGFSLRGIIHRTSAVLFSVTVLWHMLYLTTSRGKQFLRDMMPEIKDIRQFFQMNSYNLGLITNRPQFGRFSYVEKAEYWALVWGSAIMILTGIFLWFENTAVRWFSKEFLDVMLVIHYYEAWLATLAIAIWHLYSTVFNPKVYPMNPSWLTGKMPEEMYREEHPKDPIIEQIGKKE